MLRLSLLAMLLAGGPLAAGEVTLLSRADPAKAPDTPSGGANILAVSADGRWVAFEDSAPNLIAGQSGPLVANVFLHDRLNGTTVLVSRAAGSATQGGNGASGYPSISADGRYVYFASQATDLVAGQVDAAGSYDVFVFDRVSGSTALVSHAAGSPATAANGPSHVPNFDLATAFPSADGRYAAFTSSATNLVAGQVDTNAGRDVFLYDRTTGTSSLASHVPGSPVTAGSDDSTEPFLSADGRWLVFESQAADLVAGKPAGVYLYDSLSGALSFVAPGNVPKISADGGRIVFLSLATDLVAGQDDINNRHDVFLAERATGALTLVSHTSASPVQTGNKGPSLVFFETNEPVLSADGRYVVFVSEATNLVAGQDDRNGSTGELDVFLFDRVTGTVSLVSSAESAPAAQTGDRQSLGPSISADGRYVTFFSQARNLVPGQVDVNQGPFFSFDMDVFLYDRVTGTQALVSHASGSATTTGSSASILTRVSADGSHVAFFSRARDLAAGVFDDNGADDVFLYDRAAGTNVLASPRNGTPEAAAGGAIAVLPSTALSHDGRWVAFISSARDVDSGAEDANGTTDVFLFDRLTSAISLVSRDAATGEAAGGTSPLVTADGSSIAFRSSAPNLVPGQVNPAFGSHLFLFNRSTGATILVTHAAGSPVTTADQGPFTTDPSISADGRWVAFASTAADLVAGRVGGVYLWDRNTGGLAWVGPGDQPEISDDGRWIAFQSTAADAVPGQTEANAGTDVFLWDRDTAATILVSRSAVSATTTGNGSSAFAPILSQTDSPDVLSADGRWVVFTSNATDLVPGATDGNSRADVFLFDRVDGTTTLVSHASSSSLSVANNESSDPGISADGSRIAFLSGATNLVPGQVDGNANWDLFVYRRSTGAVSLASHAAASPVQAGNVATSLLPRLSADGSFLAFTSLANNLVSGDFQVDDDAFLFSDPPAGQDFFTLAPCRLLDTRSPGQGPALASGLTRVVPVHGLCGVPPEARTIAANITVTAPTGAGYLAFHPGDTGVPGTSTLNFGAGQTRANNALVSLALDGTGSLAVTPIMAGNGTVQVIVDVTGWFEEPEP